jgi:hypothetical protein
MPLPYSAYIRRILLLPLVHNASVSDMCPSPNGYPSHISVAITSIQCIRIVIASVVWLCYSIQFARLKMGIFTGVRTPVSTIYTRLHIWFESALIITELDLLRNRQRIYQNCYIYKGSCAIQRLVG